jgi:hypothetical protein
MPETGMGVLFLSAGAKAAGAYIEDYSRKLEENT